MKYDSCRLHDMFSRPLGVGDLLPEPAGQALGERGYYLSLFNSTSPCLVVWQPGVDERQLAVFGEGSIQPGVCQQGTLLFLFFEFFLGEHSILVECDMAVHHYLSGFAMPPVDNQRRVGPVIRLIVLDSENGCVQIVRSFSLNWDFYQHLIQIVISQVELEYTEADYQHQLSAFYQRYTIEDAYRLCRSVPR